MRALLKQVALIFLVMIIGTGIDWFAHGLSPEYAVPFYYFPDKLLFGTIIGSIALWIFRRFVRNPGWLAFSTTLTIAILLQTRYFLLGYALDFVLLFMVIHFVAFFLPAFFLFRLFKKAL